mmetsp:Transcript_17687/g.40831  ORF Transcript_17687/g.40831 Transcript_17687/m.40831 type:complete len:244 (+) Transcript_17687:267-998(+)
MYRAHCSHRIRALALIHHVVARKQVLRVLHGLELEVVARGVLEEHCPLLARHPLEPQVRLDDELDARVAHLVRKGLPLLFVEGKPKVRNRHLIPVDRVIVVNALVVIASPVTYNLMPVEAVVHPLAGGDPPLRAPESSPVEFACFLNVANRKRQVERLPRSGGGVDGEARLGGSAVRHHAQPHRTHACGRGEGKQCLFAEREGGGQRGGDARDGKSGSTGEEGQDDGSASGGAHRKHSVGVVW